jgi:hypothetical protein
VCGTVGLWVCGTVGLWSGVGGWGFVTYVVKQKGLDQNIFKCSLLWIFGEGGRGGVALRRDQMAPEGWGIRALSPPIKCKYGSIRRG